MREREGKKSEEERERERERERGRGERGRGGRKVRVRSEGWTTRTRKTKTSNPPCALSEKEDAPRLRRNGQLNANQRPTTTDRKEHKRNTKNEKRTNRMPGSKFEMIHVNDLPVSAIHPETGRRMSSIASGLSMERPPQWVFCRFFQDASPSEGSDIENPCPNQGSLNQGTSSSTSKGKPCVAHAAQDLKRGAQKNGWYNVSVWKIEIHYPPSMDVFEKSPFVTPPLSPFKEGGDSLLSSMLSGTEFFSGSGRLSSSLEKQGFLMFRVDRDCDAREGKVGRKERMWKRDFSDLSPAEMRMLVSVSYVHASFPCNTYSNLATSKHKRHAGNRYLGVGGDSHAANGLLLKFFYAVRSRMAIDPSLLFTIENPDATFHLTQLGKQMCLPFSEGGIGASLVRFTFCAFGESVRKRTILLTNSKTILSLFCGGHFYCDGGGRGSKRLPCSFSGRHHDPISRRGADGEGVDAKEVTPFPPLFADLIASCIKTDVLRVGMGDDFEPCWYPGCLFPKGHTSNSNSSWICSHECVPHKKKRKRTSPFSPQLSSPPSHPSDPNLSDLLSQPSFNIPSSRKRFRSCLALPPTCVTVVTAPSLATNPIRS